MPKIDDLKPFFGVVSEKIGLVVIRTWIEEETKKCYLQLNCHSLQTTILTGIDINEDIAGFRSAIIGTKYQLYQLNSVNESNLSRGGISSLKGGFATTIDLCPSLKNLDFDFFEWLVKYNIDPIYVCISGLWIEKHSLELIFLKSLKLNFIWVNHSFNHFLNSRMGVFNFMLSTDTDVEFEVLHNEKLFLENSLLPSAFFRFPGLVTNQALCEKIISYGLIPLGANSWLARGEEIKDGSIILIHANGNEREGLELYRNKMFETSSKSISI